MVMYYNDKRLVHMSRGDSYLWSKFLDKHEYDYGNYRYDVRVGTKTLLDPTAPAWLRKSAEMLSQKRIDVVMDDRKFTYTVEVRVNAKAGVIGDLIVYRQLYNARFKPVRHVLPMLITDTPSADLVIALKQLKILYFTV